MTTRDTAIAKLQQLSEPLLQEVSDFIDFVIHKYQAKPDTQPAETIAESWSQWFETVDPVRCRGSALFSRSFRRRLG
jgi:hypothetical protein